jgi:hypothetical protein
MARQDADLSKVGWRPSALSDLTQHSIQGIVAPFNTDSFLIEKTVFRAAANILFAKA